MCSLSKVSTHQTIVFWCIIYDLFFWRTLSISSLLCLQISEKEDETVCWNISRYILEHTLTKNFQINSCVIYGFSQSESQKKSKSKVSCLDTISSVDWQKFENTRHLACGTLLKKVISRKDVLFCVAFHKVRCDFTSPD